MNSTCSAHKPLSEPHNYGRIVYESRDGLIIKPRSIVWEELFIGKIGFVEDVTNTIAKKNPEFSGFTLPNLTFSRYDQVNYSIEKLVVSPTDYCSKIEIEKIGNTFALLIFFGITDLHQENIFFGRDSKGKLIFTPIDVEIVLECPKTLGQSGLVPDAAYPFYVSAISHLKKLVNNVGIETVAAPLIYGYLKTLSLLAESESELNSLMLTFIDIQSTPIRVAIRKSKSYSNFLNGIYKQKEFQIPPIPSEQAQLERRDIPYFFRFPNDETLYYYDNFLNPIKVPAKDVSGMILLKKRIVSENEITPNPHLNQIFRTGPLQIIRGLCYITRHFESKYKSTNILSKYGMAYLWDEYFKIKLKCSLQN